MVGGKRADRSGRVAGLALPSRGSEILCRAKLAS